MSASQSNAKKSTEVGDHATYSFLNNLNNATNESSIKVHIARMWDNLHVYKKKELISIDMVLIDEESNYIHAALPKEFAAGFRGKKKGEWIQENE